MLYIPPKELDFNTSKWTSLDNKQGNLIVIKSFLDFVGLFQIINWWRRGESNPRPTRPCLAFQAMRYQGATK